MMVMFESERHDVLWEMWISNPFKEESFEEFKSRALTEIAENSQSKAQREADAIKGMTDAMALLGGDFVGN